MDGPEQELRYRRVDESVNAISYAQLVFCPCESLQSKDLDIYKKTTGV